MRRRLRKNQSEIRDLYFTKIKPQAKKLLVRRDQAQRKMLISSVFMLALILVVAWTCRGFLHQKNGAELYSKILAGLVGLAVGICEYFWRSYVTYYKKQIIRPIFDAFIQSANYDPEGMVESTHLRRSKLLTKFDDAEGEDLVRGVVGTLPVEFSFVRAHRLRRFGQRNRKDIIFHGLFFTFTLSRSHDHHTVILKDTLERTFGQFWARTVQRKTAPDGLSLVQVESPEFEKHFMVYSSSQVKSRVLLAPRILANLEDFRARHKEAPNMCLRDDKLHLSLRQSRKLFRPRFFNDVVRLDDLAPIYDLIKMVEEVQHELDLAENTAA